MTVITDQTTAPVAGQAVVEVPTTPTLQAGTHRCDRCGAQAFIRAVLPPAQDSDGVPSAEPEVLLCAHHGRQHMPKLRSVAVRIIDETGFINKEASASSPL